MMGNVTIKNPTNYNEQLSYNNEQMANLLNALFPKSLVPHQEIYQIISFLEETDVNPAILPRVIRGINNLLIGSGNGQVIIHVKGDETNVQIRETGEVILSKIEK